MTGLSSNMITEMNDNEVEVRVKNQSSTGGKIYDIQNVVKKSNLPFLQGTEDNFSLENILRLGNFF